MSSATLYRPSIKLIILIIKHGEDIFVLIRSSLSSKFNACHFSEYISTEQLIYKFKSHNLDTAVIISRLSSGSKNNTKQGSWLPNLNLFQRKGGMLEADTLQYEGKNPLCLNILKTSWS